MTNLQKDALRKEYKAKRALISSERLRELSNLICEGIVSLPEFKEAEQIFLYYPIKGEASPLALLNISLDMGKRVGFPISNTENFTLEFYSAESENDFTTGAYSIPEPRKNGVKLTQSEKTLCIVPALLFSKDFQRLGYGKGFYDRFLASFKGTSIGFAMSDFIIDTLPKEKTDIPLDIIVSEKGALRRE